MPIFKVRRDTKPKDPPVLIEARTEKEACRKAARMYLAFPGPLEPTGSGFLATSYGGSGSCKVIFHAVQIMKES